MLLRPIPQPIMLRVPPVLLLPLMLLLHVLPADLSCVVGRVYCASEIGKCRVVDDEAHGDHGEGEEL